MKKIIINKTIFLFLSINDMQSLKMNELKKIKEEYLSKYDNCIIYNYYELRNKKSLIKDRINKQKSISQKKVFARDCEIKEINNVLKNEFLNTNHIQGSDKSQISYGAFYNNELVSVMTFDNVKGMNGGINEFEYDLSRFCIKTGHIIVGVFSKILKKFIFDYKPNTIKSFADLNFVNKDHNIYELNGFKLVKTIRPDFKILNVCRDNIYHKFTYGDKFFKNPNIDNETKELTQKNIYKIWNCGKLKYELYLNDGNIIFGLIYMIRNKINNKKYIGQTVRSLKKRIYEYRSAYKFGTFHNEYLKNAFNKYGWDNFEFSIIDTANTMEVLNEKEIKCIKEYNTTNKTIGYNIESGGNNAIPSAETLEKLSKSHTGIKQDNAWIEKRIPKAGSEEAKKFGRSKTEEEKKFLSENSPKFWLGKTRSDKTRIKISETKKANGQSEKQIIASNKSVYSINLETREVISYTSTAQAANAIKVNQSSISRYCSKDKIVDGFVWTYNKDINIEQLIADNKNQNELKEKKIDEIKMIAALNKSTIIKEPKKRNYGQQNEDWINKRIQASIKTVVKLDLRNNKILEIYVSLAEAGRKNNDGLSYGSLIRLCLGYSKQNENCVWCYEEDFINNTIPIYSKEIIRPIDTLLEEELSEIQEKFKNGSSVRELSDEYNLNFSTLSHLLKKNNGVESIFDPSCNYAAICKKTSKKFSDYLNKSGTLTAHISSLYPDVIIESKFKRKQIEINTGKPWYYDYFLFEKH